MICQFHLDLQRRNARPNLTDSSLGLPTVSLGSFHVATRRVHDAVMDEFSDSHADQGVGTEASQEGVVPVDPDMPAKMTGNDISLAEIQSRAQDA
jgi:hypothetical protein